MRFYLERAVFGRERFCRFENIFKRRRRFVPGGKRMRAENFFQRGENVFLFRFVKIRLPLGRRKVCW